MLHIFEVRFTDLGFTHQISRGLFAIGKNTDIREKYKIILA